MQVFRMIGPFDTVENLGRSTFKNFFILELKTKKNLSEISKRGQLRKPAKPMLKEKSETWTANLPFRFNRTILN